MALPIWGLWMKKCIADGTVGVSDNDVFVIPETAAIGCTGNEQTVSETETMEDYYFE
jgi:hypothetical protein